MSRRRLAIMCLVLVTGLSHARAVSAGSPCIYQTPIAFAPSSLPHDPVNSLYPSQTITGNDGIAPALLNITAGTIPPGITVSAQPTYALQFSGTPTSVGYFPFNVHGIPESGCFFYGPADQLYWITVDFLDVPAGNAFEPFIMKLFSNGVTAGCDTTHYCPTGLILRSSMAVFIIKAEHGSTYVPPAATGIFADVPATNAFAPWIEEIYHENITGGCALNPLRYCPGNYVIRAQMAVFLLKAKWGPSYVPPASAQIFADVPPSSPFEPWINEIYNEGIIPGCGGSNFCPSDNVNRVSMAVYVVLTFNLNFPLP